MQVRGGNIVSLGIVRLWGRRRLDTDWTRRNHHVPVATTGMTSDPRGLGQHNHGGNR